MDLEQHTLDFLRTHGSDRFRAKELARRLGLRGHDSYNDFRETLDRLARAGHVKKAGDFFSHARTERAPGGASGSASPVVGRLTVHPQGFGFVSVEGEIDDFFVRGPSMGSALDGDTVEISVRDHSAPAGGPPRIVPAQRREARVTNVVTRGRTQLVGTLTPGGAGAVVRPDDGRITRTVWVREEDFAGATGGDKVVVALRDYGETPDDALKGFITRVLGRADDPAVRVLALALAQGIRADFPEEVEADAAAIPDVIPAEETARRLDFRPTRVFTIDPVDAKDFDDAIHATALDDGSFELGVHIADVSHYVREGTALDDEAFLRATSVYLVDRVIPMLPEHLSNRVCSLVPHEDRLTYSCVMRVSAGGELLSWKVGESVIHSHHRFSYEGAQAILDGLEEHEYGEDLRLAGRVAATLTARRMQEGSVDFDSAEVKIQLDENGHAVGVKRKERQASNRLIEEFMLLANRAVALESQRRPFVYRVHEPPDPERIANLANYVKPFGLALPNTNGVVTSRDLNALLAQVSGTDEGVVITQAALRSMSKAKYSGRNAGHFGLGFSHYAHFTSPIRRYPDLVVHRLTKRYLAGGADADAEDLESGAMHCSLREREAEKAERESVKLKQVEYLQDRVGEAFDGVVTGVAKFGMFVEISDVLAEGLVHISELRDDRYEHDERRMTLFGRNTGRSFRPGTRVRVVVLKADVDTRTIDLGLDDGGPVRPAFERSEDGALKGSRSGAPAIKSGGPRSRKPGAKPGAKPSAKPGGQDSTGASRGRKRRG